MSPRRVIISLYDVNENNVTLAFFEGFKLKELRRYETGLGRVVVNYSLRLSLIHI